MKNKILYIVAAGSGGHILPALTLADRWLKNNTNGKVIFWGCTGALDQKIVAKHDFLSETISLNIGKFSLKRILLLPVLILQILYIFFKSFFRALKDRPEKIISTGGLISIPVCLGCKMSFRPIELYELNVEPGKAVKFLMPVASKIYVVFEKTISQCKLIRLNFSKKCVLIKYPIRFDRATLKTNKKEFIDFINEKSSLPFSDQRKTIFLLGGSQGSRLLNQTLKTFLETHKNFHDKIQIIHQTGFDLSFDWESFYKNMSIPAVVFSFNENIQNFYQLSDLIICRAGAGTLFEIEFFNKQCIVIPLTSSTTDHQVQNAEEMARLHPNLFKVIYQNELTPEVFANAILPMT